MLEWIARKTRGIWWLDWLAKSIEAYTSLATQYPFLDIFIRVAIAVGAGALTYFQQSWLPFAVMVALGFYLLTSSRLATSKSQTVAAPPVPSAPLVESSDPLAKMTIGAAIRYIQQESSWGHGKHENVVVQALDSALEGGTLTAWGRVCVNWRPTKTEQYPPACEHLVFAPDEQPIAQYEWISMKLWQGSMSHPNPTPHKPHMSVPRREGSAGLSPPKGYIRLGKRDVERMFPLLFSA